MDERKRMISDVELGHYAEKQRDMARNSKDERVREIQRDGSEIALEMLRNLRGKDWYFAEIIK